MDTTANSASATPRTRAKRLKALKAAATLSGLQTSSATAKSTVSDAISQPCAEPAPQAYRAPKPAEASTNPAAEIPAIVEVSRKPVGPKPFGGLHVRQS